jgi:hypothetical protein
MKKEERNTEMDTIKYILQHKYQINNTLKRKLRGGYKTHQHNQEQKEGNWATLTYQHKNTI